MPIIVEVTQRRTSNKRWFYQGKRVSRTEALRLMAQADVTIDHRFSPFATRRPSHEAAAEAIVTEHRQPLYRRA